MNIGVLDVQGGVLEHIEMLKKFSNVFPLKVKTNDDIKKLDGLIIPGGESTAIGKIIKKYKLDQSINYLFENNIPIWGTCAGMILLAKKVENQESILKLIDIDVSRNSFGGQLNSFVTKEKIKNITEKPVKLVFIRAPIIKKVGSDVKILHVTKNNIVAAESENVVVTAFHPELTNDIFFHQYFIDKVRKHLKNKMK